MERIFEATYVDGAFKTTEAVEFPTGTKAKIVVNEPVERLQEADEAWGEFMRLTEEMALDPGEPRLTREQLHDRRL